MNKSFEDLMQKNYKPKRGSQIKRRFRRIVSFPRHQYYTLRAFYHRGKRGWSVPDTWDLDGYLARVMGESIAHLAESTHGWPGESAEWPTFEDWQKELREVSTKLIAYDKDRWTWMDLEQNQKINDELVDALTRLSKYWGYLWD